LEEHQRVLERLEFLRRQRDDLEQARGDIQQVIAEIERVTREQFLATLEQVGREFQDLFVRLFGGGSTEIYLSDPEDVMESGVEIEVTVPGKHRQNLLLLSGGERAMTAVAILFALLRVKPSPFVILDEIDAPLDDANTTRFCELLRDFAGQSQFIVITHNKGTMEAADMLYGVTMEEAGVSKLISVRLTAEASAVAA
jgi:chromosome segregation protein